MVHQWFFGTAQKEDLLPMEEREFTGCGSGCRMWLSINRHLFSFYFLATRLQHMNYEVYKYIMQLNYNRYVPKNQKMYKEIYLQFKNFKSVSLLLKLVRKSSFYPANIRNILE